MARRVTMEEWGFRCLGQYLAQAAAAVSQQMIAKWTRERGGHQAGGQASSPAGAWRRHPRCGGHDETALSAGLLAQALWLVTALLEQGQDERFLRVW